MVAGLDRGEQGVLGWVAWPSHPLPPIAPVTTGARGLKGCAAWEQVAHRVVKDAPLTNQGCTGKVEATLGTRRSPDKVLAGPIQIEG
jgi:homoserine acetyltransferase